MDAMREDTAEVEVTEEDAEDRTQWRWKICFATIDGISRKKKKKLGTKCEVFCVVQTMVEEEVWMAVVEVEIVEVIFS